MNHTSETNTPVTTLIQRYATLKAVVSMTQEELEEQIHAEVWRGDWTEVLRLLGLARDGVSRVVANDCITRAVHTAPAEVFAALLEQLPREEYAERETYEVDWAPTGEIYPRHRWDVSVQGTLVMHAVANNRPDLLQMLLDRGHDVNCASTASAAVLLQDFGQNVAGYGRDYIPFHAYTARPESYVKLRKWDADPEDIQPMEWEGATPLALAVLLGHAECARILVERGAWLEEAPSVSAAMYLFWREKDPDYQAARAAVLAQESWNEHRPVLWAVGETCSTQQLEAVLETWSYDRQELVRAARRMVVSLRHQRELWKTYTDGWKDLCQRMYCIGRICPEAVQAKTVIGEFLDHFFSWKGASIEPLLPILEGATLDISEMRVGIYYLDRASGQRIFKELAEHCELVMGRDTLAPDLPAGVLRLLLKHVTFLPPVADRGISGLTRNLLRSGDLRLVRSALKNGLIPPEESTEELLRCQQALRLPAVCRSALLTTPRPWKRAGVECPLVGDLSYRWFADSVPERSMPILDDKDWEKWFWPTLRTSYGQRTVKAAGEEWQLHKTFIAACMEGRVDIVKAWLPYMEPEELHNTSSMLCAEKNVHVIMTPLCAAAIAGQTEIVELLLAWGAPLREELWGSPSTCTDCWTGSDKGNQLSLNPVLAAALGGHWDTVKYLLSRGAVCDWSAPENQHIWSQFQKGALQEAAAQYLRGGAGNDVSTK